MKSIVEKINLSIMSNELHYKFIQDVINYIKKYPDAVIRFLGLSKWLPKLFAAFEIEEKVLDIVLSSVLTPEMAEADRRRGNAFAGLVSAIKNLFHHADNEVKKAAKRLMTILKHYGNIPKRKYDEESAAILDILREFQKQQFADDLKLLKVTEWVERLEAENNAFIALRDRRVAEKNEIPHERMKDARVETDEHYHDFVAFLELKTKESLLDDTTDDTTLADFIDGLNTLIKSYKDVIAHSKTKSHKPHDENENENNENENENED